MMKRLGRRTVVRIAARLGLAVAGLPLLAGCDRAPRAAREGPVPRIGYLSEFTHTPHWPPYKALLEGLAERGWVEGRTLAIEHRFAEGQPDRLPALAAELVGLNVDLIVAEWHVPTWTARRATVTIPIVMLAGSLDPVAEGLAASLARPGGNVTGTTSAPHGYWSRGLELAKATVPGLARLGHLWDAHVYGPYQTAREALLSADATRWLGLAWRALDAAAQELGVEFVALDVHTPDLVEVGAAVAAAVREGVDGLLLSGRFVTQPYVNRIAELALAYGLPTFSVGPAPLQVGQLLTYTVTWPPVFRRGAALVDKILRGTPAGELPIEQPTQFELVINLKTARALGLTVPPSVLAQATEIIQ